MSSKLLYLDWIYGSNRDNLFSQRDESPLQNEIIEKVRGAVGTLSGEEREFVQLYWFEGKPLVEIGQLLGREPSRLDALNRSVMRKLRARLSEYVATRFGVKSASDKCVICDHPRKPEIDSLLIEKPPEDTFRNTMAVLSREYNLRLTTPQILIGHMKYHMNLGR